MFKLVVLFAGLAVAARVVESSYVTSYAAPLALAPNTPAVVLNAHGVPLDTPEVVAARALHYQAKALQGYHSLKKRSLTHGVVAYAAPSAVSHQSRVDVHFSPAVVATELVSTPVVAARYATPLTYAVPSAVSHQSRVDVHSSPAVLAAPVAYTVPAASVVAYSAPSALSHQSRVDVHSSPVLASTLYSAPYTYTTPYSFSKLHAAPALAYQAAW